MENQTKTTRIVFTIDRSGSMNSIRQATIDGINSYISEQKSLDLPCSVTLNLFDHEYTRVYSNVDLKDVTLLDASVYVPRGMTALYDAVCKTIVEANFSETDLPVIVIMTDGFENNSKEFKASDVKRLIEEKTALGWQFVFLGANQDAVQTASDLGIARGKSVTYSADSASTDKMFRAMSMKMSNYRSAGGASADSLDFSDQDRKDVNPDA